MPAASSSSSSASAEQPGKPTLVTPGSRSAGSAGRSTTASGARAATAADQAARSARDRELLLLAAADGHLEGGGEPGHGGDVEGARSGPRAPDRRRAAPRSASTSRRASSAPIPYGPPSLCAVKVIRSSPLARSRRAGDRPPGRRRCGTARRARRAERPRPRRPAGRVPTSLLAHITETSGRRVVDGLGERRLGRAGRCASTGTSGSLAPAAWASQPAESSTAWCSTAEMTTVGPPRGRPADQYAPLTARLSASVPPEVKITSAGCAPTWAAIDSRASSTTRRAARPEPCSDDAFPDPAELAGHRLDRLGHHRRGRRVVEVGPAVDLSLAHHAGRSRRSRVPDERGDLA